MNSEDNQFRGTCARCGSYLGLHGRCDCDVPEDRGPVGYGSDWLPAHKGVELGWFAYRYIRYWPMSDPMPTKEMALADLERKEAAQDDKWYLVKDVRFAEEELSKEPPIRQPEPDEVEWKRKPAMMSWRKSAFDQVAESMDAGADMVITTNRWYYTAATWDRLMAERDAKVGE